MSKRIDLSCPVPTRGPQGVIRLADGEGSRAARKLIQERILPKLKNPWLTPLNDGAICPIDSDHIVMTTDSFVVSPRFFPGGNIGTLAVYGTVNDLVVSGAKPQWLSLSMIVEEGFPLDELDTILESIAQASEQNDVAVVTGDTKVVPRGTVDGLFLTTTGVGELVSPAPSGPSSLQPGDQLIVTGPIGQHGVSILSIREGIDFSPMPTSDCASLLEAANQLRDAQVTVRTMRDATRGGVAAILHEWAETCGLTLTIHEAEIPLSPEVQGVCELLGLDPLHLACEGTMVVAVPAENVAEAQKALQRSTVARSTTVIGEVCERKASSVTVVRAGKEIPLDEPLGPPVPRIC